MQRKNVKAKLKSQKGETLPELLASILIGSLSIALLVGAIVASVQIDRQAAAADARLYAGVNEAERKEEAPVCTQGVTVKEGGKPDIIIDADFYGKYGLYSYRYSP